MLIVVSLPPSLSPLESKTQKFPSFPAACPVGRFQHPDKGLWMEAQGSLLPSPPLQREKKTQLTVEKPRHTGRWQFRSSALLLANTFCVLGFSHILDGCCFLAGSLSDLKKKKKDTMTLREGGPSMTEGERERRMITKGSSIYWKSPWVGLASNPLG